MIKSIPTRYAGILFRSRLEADWARALDEVEIRWVYETEGFAFDDDIAYLPDFWLPNLSIFVEVKGILDAASERKILRLAKETADHGIAVVMAVAPAGKRWAVVADGEFKYGDGFWTCPDCGKKQFRIGDCRSCPALPERPFHDPPYSVTEWDQIWEWYAVQFERNGRNAEAEEFRRQIVGVER